MISIIIPNLNNAARLDACLQAVLAECAGRSDVEVIVVDNGSSDNSVEVANKYGLRILEESRLPSPYLARNKGIRAAQGTVIVLLDSNCIPIKGWLQTGVEKIRAGVAIVTPVLRFDTIGQHDYLAKFDALYAVIREQPGAEISALPCTNLFIDRQVFTQIGLFDGRVRSLEDIAWTGRAHAAGFQLGIAGRSRVWYPAKSGINFLKKMYRLGRGKKERAVLQTRIGTLSYVGQCAKQLLPPSPEFVRRMHRLGIEEELPIPLPVVFGLCYLTKVSRGLGMIWGKVNRELYHRPSPEIV